MSAITLDDVKKLAQLSALAIDEGELGAMQADLEQILSYVAQLDAIDTEGIEPTYSVHGLETVTRNDAVVDYGVSQEKLLANAPQQKDGFIIVPRVLE